MTRTGRFPVAAALLAIVAAPSLACATPQLSAAGYGKLAIGSRLADAKRAYRLATRTDYTDDCAIYTTTEAPGLHVYVEHGIVTRVSVMAQDSEGAPVTPAIRTSAGIGVGSTEADLRAAYPGFRHLYGAKLLAAPGDPLRNVLVLPEATRTEPGLRLDLDGSGRVREISAGVQPALGYREGCN